jgi:anti-sigma regulatory factor (Ser/Thr protein kinase)
MTGVDGSTLEGCLTTPLDTPQGWRVVTWPVGEARGAHRSCILSLEMPQEPRVLAEFQLESVPGNERVAAQRAIAVLTNLGLTERRLQQLETAVAEAALNAIEHGNQFDASKPVGVRVMADSTEVCVWISDEGSGCSQGEVETPDIFAKLAGQQTPRGWGLFLMSRLVDGFSDEYTDGRHAMLLRVRRPADTDNGGPA